ncbi:MAG: NADH-quinone oxidoreductase subunit NuoK, partial [Gluconacetobacter liquefaciens]
MSAASPTHALLLATLLFAVGMLGVLARRNLLLMLMSIEIMLNAAALAFIAAGARWHAAQGQVMFLMILSLAAAEAAVRLANLLPQPSPGR